MAARISQVQELAIVAGTPKARASQVQELAIVAGSPKARMSQLWELAIVDYTVNTVYHAGAAMSAATTTYYAF